MVPTCPEAKNLPIPSHYNVIIYEPDAPTTKADTAISWPLKNL